MAEVQNTPSIFFTVTRDHNKLEILLISPKVDFVHNLTRHWGLTEREESFNQEITGSNFLDFK